MTIRDILRNMSQFYSSGLAEMSPVGIGVLCLIQRGYEDEFWLMVDPQNHLSVFLKQFHKGTTISYKMFKRLELGEDDGFIKIKEGEINKGPFIGPAYHEICQLHCAITERGVQYLDTLPRMAKLLGVKLWYTGEVEAMIKECPLEEFPELLACSNVGIRKVAAEVYKELYGTSTG